MAIPLPRFGPSLKLVFFQVLELTDGKPALHLGSMIVNDSALGHVDGGIFHCGREDVDLSGTQGEVAGLYTARGMVTGQPTNRAPFRGSVICEERNGRIFCGNEPARACLCSYIL